MQNIRSKGGPRRLAALAVASILVLAGCAAGPGVQPTPSMSQQADAFANGKRSELQPFFRALYLEGERNAVLNLKYLGLAAMSLGDERTAALSFDLALERIEAIYADDPNAEKARSLWNEEKVKDFKGEPYERAMAYYYRGLLYAKAGDYQNARASFLAADRHTSLAAREKYDASFGMMNWLAAWASWCDGDTARAQDLRQRAALQDASLGSLAYDKRFLVLIDSGVGPVKGATGQYRELLTITANATATDAVTKVESSSPDFKFSTVPVAAGDVAQQATTRGGRPVQAILDGKAQFKSGANTVGDVSLAVGQAALQQALLSDNRGMAQLGAFGSLLGLAAKIAAQATTPAADTRGWTSLPDKLWVGQADALPAAGTQIRVAASDGLTSSVVTPHLTGTSGQCGLAWARTRSAQSTAHNGTARLGAVEVNEAGREQRNAAFRAHLQATFPSAGANPAVGTTAKVGG